MTISRTDIKSAVELRSVGKKYPYRNKASDDFWALREVSFSVAAGRITGIIGRNGAGKTTLLNLIAGVLTPSEGDIGRSGRVLGLFNLGVGFLDELTGRENIFLNGSILGASRKELDGKLAAIIEFSELGDFIDMPLGTYSQGMRLRLGFSILVSLDFDILVIDEVLAVGDALFQNKCYERLLEFKRAGKTLIITTQAMDFIERLCDSVVLLDHGALLFEGTPAEAVNRYRNLLNTEKFFVGLPQRMAPVLVENTKKWADNTSDWGKKFGGKEIMIDEAVIEDAAGSKTSRIRTGERFRVRVSFTVREKVEKPHFGVAIFRQDGVYCYGPNTEFDGYAIPELKLGTGDFTLEYAGMLLAPGSYRMSVAVWDKNESLAFDHHFGFYPLDVEGPSQGDGALLNMPFEVRTPGLLGWLRPLFFPRGAQQCGMEVQYVKAFDAAGKVKDVFMTGEPVRLSAGVSAPKVPGRRLEVRFGIYRDDGIFCQGVSMLLKSAGEHCVVFPALSLLPGSYFVSAGIWDTRKGEFLVHRHGVLPFRMVFTRKDHGTVYMEHVWRWEVK